MNHPDLLLKYLQNRNAKLPDPSQYDGTENKRQKVSPIKAIGSWDEPIDLDDDDDFDIEPSL